jgi:hypothetical protein
MSTPLDTQKLSSKPSSNPSTNFKASKVLPARPESKTSRSQSNDRELALVDLDEAKERSSEDGFEGVLKRLEKVLLTLAVQELFDALVKSSFPR